MLRKPYFEVYYRAITIARHGLTANIVIFPSVVFVIAAFQFFFFGINREDCRSPRKLLYCCGMGQKKCRLSCGTVRCEKNEDCGKSMYYCGKPNIHNVSTCKFTHITDMVTLHDVNLDYLDYN